MNSNKKFNFAKLGQTSAILASLSLPTVISGITANSSPTPPIKTPIFIPKPVSTPSRPRLAGPGSYGIANTGKSPLTTPGTRSAPRTHTTNTQNGGTGGTTNPLMSLITFSPPPKPEKPTPVKTPIVAPTPVSTSSRIITTGPGGTNTSKNPQLNLTNYVL